MRKTVAIIVLVLVVVIGVYKLATRNIPPINDITTDTETPPAFKHIKVADYGGPDVAAKQKKAYPDILPYETDAPLDQVFSKALKIVNDSGWEIVFADAAKGRIEATATTPLMRFKDDIVILMSLVPKGVRVDMRSLSRVGKGDLGANAKRIRELLDKLRAG